MSLYAVNDNGPKFIFMINYKVMYSSLHDILPNHFSAIKFYDKVRIVKENVRFRDYLKFAIVRNPFSRSVSAFFGKCDKNPTYNLRNDSAQLEYSQLQLLNTLKLIRDEHFEISQPAIFYNYTEHPNERKLLDSNFEKLKSISFEEYVNCLTIIFKSENIDGHFNIQSDLFSIPKQSYFLFPYNVYKNTKIVKLENIDQDWNLICQELGKDMNLVKVNKTEHLRSSYQSFYTDKTRDEIANLYKKDFSKFGYSTQL